MPVINRYNFNKIIADTAKKVPTLPKEPVDPELSFLLLLETALKRLHYDSRITASEALDTLRQCLYDIRSVVEGTEFDTSALISDRIRDAADHIETLFIPSKSKELMESLKPGTVPDDSFFMIARQCIVKVAGSIEFWTKNGGRDGYFNFISRFTPVDFLGSFFMVDNRYLTSPSPTAIETVEKLGHKPG